MEATQGNAKKGRGGWRKWISMEAEGQHPSRNIQIFN